MLEQIGLTDKWDREAFQLCIISFDELDVAKEKFFIRVKDELVEVTPKSIRMRKMILNREQRMKQLGKKKG